MDVSNCLNFQPQNLGMDHAQTHIQASTDEYIATIPEGVVHDVYQVCDSVFFQCNVAS